MPIVNRASNPDLIIEPDATVAWTNPSNVLANILTVLRATDPAVNLLERNDSFMIQLGLNDPTTNAPLTFECRGIRQQFFDDITISQLRSRMGTIRDAATLSSLARLDKRSPGNLVALYDNVVEALRYTKLQYADSERGTRLENVLANLSSDPACPTRLLMTYMHLFSNSSSFVMGAPIHPLGYQVADFAQLFSAVTYPVGSGEGSDTEATITIPNLCDIINAIRTDLAGSTSGADVHYGLSGVAFYEGIQVLATLDDIAVLENSDNLFAFLEAESSLKDSPLPSATANTDPTKNVDVTASATEFTIYKDIVSRATRALSFKVFQVLRPFLGLIKFYLPLFRASMLPRVITQLRTLTTDEPSVKEALDFFTNIQLGKRLDYWIHSYSLSGVEGRRYSSAVLNGHIYPTSKLPFIVNEAVNIQLYEIDGLLHRLVELHQTLKTLNLANPELLSSIGSMIYGTASPALESNYSFSIKADADVDYTNWTKRSKDYSNIDAFWKRKPVYLAPTVNLPDQQVLCTFRIDPGLEVISSLATGLTPVFRFVRQNHNQCLTNMTVGAQNTWGILDVMPVAKHSRSYYETLADKNSLFKTMMPAQYHLTYRDSDNVMYFHSVQNFINRLKLSGANVSNIGYMWPHFNAIGFFDVGSGQWRLHDSLIYIAEDCRAYYSHNFVNLNRFTDDVRVCSWFNNNLLAWLDDNSEQHCVVVPPTIDEYKSLLRSMSLKYGISEWARQFAFKDKTIFY